MSGRSNLLMIGAVVLIAITVYPFIERTRDGARISPDEVHLQEVESFAAEFRREYEVEVQVVDEEGVPVPGAFVDVSTVQLGSTRSRRERIKTDRNGKVRVSRKGLSMHLAATAEGYQFVPGGVHEGIQSEVGLGYDGGAIASQVVLTLLRIRESEEALKEIGNRSAKFDEDGVANLYLHETAGSDAKIRFWIEVDPPAPGRTRFRWNVRAAASGCRVVVPEGTVSSEAPREGYVEEVFFDFSNTELGSGWKRRLELPLFIQFESGFYAVIRVSVIPYGDRFVVFNGFMNKEQGNRQLRAMF